MKFLFSAFLILHFCLSTFAQSDKVQKEIRRDYQMIDSAYARSYKNGSIIPINKLIQSNKITINETRTYLLCQKAVFLEYLYIFKEGTDAVDLKNPSKIILNLYDSILTQSECLFQPKVKSYRYQFLSSLVYRYNRKLNKNLTNLYKEAKSELKSIGLKPNRDGFGLGIYSIHGKENWIGLDFSVFSHFQGVSYLRFKCKDKDMCYRLKQIAARSTNALTFSYSKGFNSKTNDLAFSLIEMNAPFTIIPLRFGVQTEPESNNKRFYYRPGLGLSVGMISMSYSYNLMFSKSVRSSSEKHLLYFRVIYPIVNYRYRTKRY